MASTALDGFGAIPGVNEFTGALQVAGGVASAGITLYAGNGNNAMFAGTGLGLTAADKALGKVAIQTMKTTAIGGSKMIPLLGNAVSVVSAVYDVFGKGGVIENYQNCMAGR